VLSRRFATAYPPRQLPGPLYALNAALVIPAAPFAVWAVSWRIGVVLAVSAAVMAVTSMAVFHLFAQGSAAAVTAGTAASPLAAVVFSVPLLSTPTKAAEVVAATVVAAAVLCSLPGAFAALTPLRALALLIVSAAGNGLLTVLGKALLDAGAGIIEVYLCRTAAAAAFLVLVFPPRALPLRELPRMAVRASAITLSFLLLLAGLSRGTPATVQTTVATAPLILLLGGMAVHRHRPPLRVAAASLLAVAGVALVLGGGG
jgi:drug/metabolite transporter (DMT)-like permease